MRRANNQEEEEKEMDMAMEMEMEFLLHDDIPNATTTTTTNTHPFQLPDELLLTNYENSSSSSSSSSSSFFSGNNSPISDDPLRHSPELGGHAWLSDALLYHNCLHAGLGSFSYRDDAMSGLRHCANGCVGVLDQEHASYTRRQLLAESYLQPQNCGDPDSVYLSSRSPLHPLPMLHCGSEAGNRRVGSLCNRLAPNSLSPVRNCEDSFTIEGKGPRCVERERERWQQLNNRLHIRRGGAVLDDMYGPKLQGSPFLSLEFGNLMDMQGCIYSMAKEKHGCLFLQRKFDEGRTEEVDMIFSEIIDYAVELMANPFGNYLMQKLLDVCSGEQRMKFLRTLTQDPTDLVRISLNTHGTRAVQKLIQALKTQQEIALVVSALNPGFLDLVKDSNGNHVIQRCLQSLSPEDNQFIFDAAAKHCVNIATHRHGCCVLQCCIAHSTGQNRVNLVAEISVNGLLLAQDAFGNYVVQYIIGLEIPSATANLVSQFKGNYVHLSMQKFSSNVVEKCLKVLREEDLSTIIVELLSVPLFEHFLQDPYANYVICSALENTTGSLHAALVEAIRPHSTILRTNPYCKRIFSRALVKK